MTQPKPDRSLLDGNTYMLLGDPPTLLNPDDVTVITKGDRIVGYLYDPPTGEEADGSTIDGLKITDHPYQPTAWPDTCGHPEPDGWFCGYSEAKHADPVEEP